MIEIDYIKLKPIEFKLITLFSSILAIFFTISFIRFSGERVLDLSVFFYFFIFIFLLLVLRQVFMKIIAYKNGFEIVMRQTHFDRYYIRAYDKISYYSHNVRHNKNFHGIPTSIISILIYLFSLGIIIFPSMWNYNYKKIEHMHLGTHQPNEYDMPHMYNIGISDYRMSKALFAGYLFYFIVAFFLKVFLNILGQTLFNWYTFILLWIAFVTILPIPGTEGYEFWRKNNFAWISMITILILGIFSIFIFESILYVIGVTFFASSIIIFIVFWKKIMKKDGH